jgi:PAS domain S-box-containing protein
MTAQTVLYLLPYLASLAISAGVGLYAWHRREVAGARAYAALGELLARTLRGKVLWDDLQWVPSFIIPLTLLFFALEYTGRRPAHPWRTALALAAVPLLSLVLVATNDLHGLTMPNPTLISGTPFSALTYDFAPATVLMGIYSYLVILVGIALLVRQFARAQALYRAQAATVAIGILIPVVGSALTLAGVSFTAQRDTTPFTYALGNLVVAWGLFRFHLFNVVPIARDMLLENLPDSVVVIDAAERVVDLNPAALRALGKTAKEVIGRPVAEVYAPWAGLVEQYQGEEQVQSEIVVGEGPAQRHFELTVSTLHTRQGQPIGRLVVTHDVSARKQSEEALQTVHNELARHFEQFRLISQVGQRITSIMAVDDLLAEIVRLIQETLGYHLVSVGLIQDDALIVQKGAGAGWDEDTMAGLRLPIDQGAVALAIQHGEAQVIADREQDLRTLHLPQAMHLRSSVDVPLKTKSAVIGVLMALSDRRAAFDQSDCDVLQSLASQAAIAIENAQLYTQARQAAVLEERARLARDLHDSVTQSLYSVTLLAETGRLASGAGDLQTTANTLQRLGEVAQQTLKEMRLLVFELRPPTLDQAGLLGALQQRLDAVEARAGLEQHLLVEGTVVLAAAQEEALYRIALEALNNALKHAAATAVTVQVWADGQGVRLEVADNGRGFDPAQLDGGGMGLVTMRERAESIGAVLEVHSQPGAGTRVVVAWKTLDTDERR